MTLKDFVEQTLTHLDSYEGGTVNFDLAVLPYDPGDGTEILHIVSGEVGSSRIKFSISLKDKTAKPLPDKEKRL